MNKARNQTSKLSLSLTECCGCQVCCRNSTIAVLTFLGLGKRKNISKIHASMTATWNVTKNTRRAQRCGAACTAALTKWSVQVQPHAPNIQTTQRAVGIVCHTASLWPPRKICWSPRNLCQRLVLATTVIDWSHCSQQWYLNVTDRFHWQEAAQPVLLLSLSWHTHTHTCVLTLEDVLVNCKGLMFLCPLCANGD